MSTEIFRLQQEIIHTNQGHDVLQRIVDKGNPEYNLLDDFIILEDLDYKIKVAPTGRALSKIAANLIRIMVQRNLGDNFLSVAIRGDNKCSQRSLIALTLITARRLLYQRKKAQSLKLLYQLGQYADELNARRNEVQFNELFVHFTVENYQKIKSLLTDIAEEKIRIIDLISQANCDFSIECGPADSLNNAMAALVAFIMDKQLTDQAKTLGVSKAFLSDGQEGDYAVLTPGKVGSTSADRVAFLSALDIKLLLPILRVESVSQSLKENNITTIEQALNVETNRFKLMAEENEAGQIVIYAFNSAGHTNMVLTEEDRRYIEEELSQCRSKMLTPEKAPTAIQSSGVHWSFIFKCCIGFSVNCSVIILGIIYSLPIVIGAGVIGFSCGLFLAARGLFARNKREIANDVSWDPSAERRALPI